MGGKNQTSTTQSNQTYTPTGASQLNDIWNKVQGVASQPYTPYGGQLTADLSGTQQTAIGNLTGPNYGTAVNYAENGAQSIDPSQISRYENPYTQSVINATQNQFNNQNAQQQQQVVGNAALQGALGGDRVGVARAQLANQQQLAQAPVIANLNSQNYSQALQAAQADRAAQASGAQNLSNVSTQGALAQLGAGGVEQQTNQAGLSAQYQQYLQALAFPYQQAQFLASSGLPTVTAMGGTQAGQGTTTTPGPSPWGQAAGLGLTAAGLFLKRGGRVKGYASGGSPLGADNFMLVPSYIPQSAAPQSHAPQMTPFSMPKATASQDTGLPSQQSLSAGIGGLQRLFGGAEQLTPQTGATYAAPNIDGQDMTFGSMGGVPVPTYRSRGGAVGPHDDFVNTVHSIRRALKNGGAVEPSPFGIQGYDIGGTVDPPLSFADRALPVQEAIANGPFDPQGDNYSPFTQSPALVPSQASIPLPQARPTEAPTIMADASASPMAATRSGLPPQITNPDNANVDPEENTALGYSGTPVTDGMIPRPDSGATQEMSAQSKQSSSGGPLGNLLGLNISPEAKAGLLSAGLGMLASKSPFALQAIGEGGLQGVKAYTDQKKETADRALKQTHVDLEGKRLAQSAEQFAKNLDLHERQFGETQKQHQQTIDAPKVVAGALVNPKTGEVIYKNSNGLFDDDTVSTMAGQYLSGDKSVMQNLGRGAQGAENIVRLRSEIARQAKDAGLTPDQIATKMADFAGRTAAMRSLGTRGVNVEYAANTANRAIDLANEAIDKLPRTAFVPFNKLRQLFDTNTSSPEQAAAYAATNTLVNEYARVASGGSNQATEGMRQHAREMLNTAMNQDAFKAVTGMMRREIQQAKSAYHETRKEFLEDKSTEGKSPPAASAAPAATPSRVRQNGHTYERQPDGSMKAID